jgi:hypothetical protein
MKSSIVNYDTYANAVADLANLYVGQMVAVEETMRLYRVDDSGVQLELKPLTNGANMSLSGNILTITY